MRVVYTITAEAIESKSEGKRLVGVVFDSNLAERIKSLSDENVKFDYKSETIVGKLYYVSDRTTNN